jgi:hypothetical protein
VLHIFGAAQLERVQHEAHEQAARYAEIEGDAHAKRREAASLRRTRGTNSPGNLPGYGRPGSNWIPGKRAPARGWFALQSILSAAANLSKLLWGSRDDPDAEARRADLRVAAGVSDESVLRSPKVRNQFEHIDQKIEKWFNTSGGKGYVSRNIGQYGDIHIESDEDASRFGRWDPETGIVTFWTHSVSIPEIVTEVERILPIVSEQRYTSTDAD